MTAFDQAVTAVEKRFSPPSVLESVFTNARKRLEEDTAAGIGGDDDDTNEVPDSANQSFQGEQKS